ncbi:TetR/AcrR family transcriptional regulator [Diaphorobacter ruginosibacter]|uniref:TetR/AcrR family transcriptional regulator n=1 Tax=Diaphorobacter ruginosibacter TaxID=1715720 RepID=A0A7G9RTX7_9BURK|nr:TetR/AcrR family transcriptional regulator [Diaphorobacter ruginosibacter]QNN59052.1 TetR/AcrR family transcriptional regulator [Diaphorobacter ruginosibacter]
MNQKKQPSARGRPRTITRERIADAGIEIGIPNITFVGVAAALGVSHMALYKHVPSLAELKHLVAEEIFSRWEFTPPMGKGRARLEEYLVEFTASVREFVRVHPGVTPYVIRRLVATPAMLEKIDAHQGKVARAYGLSKDEARWLVATVAFHGFAAADSVYAAARQELVMESDFAAEVAEMEAEFDMGMRMMITGALSRLAPA